MTTRWAIVTGEYPPQAGGVADYTALVARGLADAGDAVTVYAPRLARGKEHDSPGVAVVRLADHFGPRGLLALDAALARHPRPDRILVQYVPHAYGWKAMNLPFAAWVATRAHRLAPVWVMFHEVHFPFRWRPPTHALLGATTCLMSRLVAGAASRVFVAIPAWGDRLRRICPRGKPAEWLPVPCNVGTTAEPAVVREVRDRYAGSGTRLVGHFGTFGGMITDLLGPAVAAVLGRVPDTRLLLIGRGAEHFRGRFVAAHPELAERASAAGELPPDAVAAHLRACDALVQPYPDGISCRRTSVMGGLANGVPVVSNLGALSESLWAGLSCVRLAPAPDPIALAAAAEAVLALAPAVRAEMGRRAATLYAGRFGVENTITRLRAHHGTPG
jgi:glycosyltransferase involved in cell wall biosynthesis